MVHEKGEYYGSYLCIQISLHRKELNFKIGFLIWDEHSIIECFSSIMVEGTRRPEGKQKMKGHIKIFFGEVVDVYHSHKYQ
jgi:hypothetical protein